MTVAPARVAAAVWAAVCAGDRRVWRAAALAAVPFVALLAYYCLRPRDYYTGTNSVEAYTYIAEVPADEPVCVPGLRIPAGTGRIRLLLISRTRARPALRMTLDLGGEAAEGGARTIESSLAPITAPPNRISAAEFPIPVLGSRPRERAASLCLTATGLVNWGGTPLLSVPAVAPPTVGGSPIAGRIAVWYQPPAGSQSSYLARAGEILDRAALFRPSPVGPWLYVVILLVLLPGLALASIRQLALAVAGRGGARITDAAGGDVTGASAADGDVAGTGAAGGDVAKEGEVAKEAIGGTGADGAAAARGPSARGPAARRTAAWLFAIAALNFACWALITPPFQAPDEVDHFAYTQSLVERGQAPSRDPAAPLARWSSAETLALEGMSFNSDHQVGDSRPPWTARAQRQYEAAVAKLRPRASDGGGDETAATHGAIYYAALAPAYWLASSSPLSQLTLMRLLSALIGALTVVFAYLLARELAPGRPWLAVLAGLLVAYQPMYGFIAGAVNNDVGVNAGAAALELLAIVIVRRGVTVRVGLATGALLVALPIVKGTAYSIYPVIALALAIGLYRHHRRADLRGWAALAGGAIAVRGLGLALAHTFHPATASAAAGAAPPEAGSATGSVSEALAHPLDYLAYLWQSLLPRLPFMTRHFPTTHFPAMVIFVERGWGAFGWYDVLFPHRVYYVILAAMIAVPILGLIAMWREWTSFVRANLLELALLVLMALAVVAGFEAAFYTPGARPFIAEFGRYAFPAIAPLAVLVVASLHAFGRRWAMYAGVGLLVAMLALSYASQLLTLTGFYA